MMLMSVFAISGDAAWTPPREAQQGSHLWDIIRKLGVSNVEDLHALAVKDPGRYYGALIEHLDIRFSKPYRELVDLQKGPEFPRWFPGGRLNLVDTCLSERLAPVGEAKAVTVMCEDGDTATSLTYADLRREVQKLANFLVSVGVTPGDCVGLFMPMTAEATIAFFACAWVGAVAVPAFSGYGPDALSARLRDSKAKVLITSPGFRRRGAWVDMLSVAIAATPTLESLRLVITVGDLPEGSPRGPVWTSWREALSAGENAVDLPPVPLDPNAPLLLMYTSGTTGRPKGIVHSHAGFLLKVASDYALALNLRQGDKLFWVTDLGWLVGPQMIVGNSAIGSNAVYYVGALDMPDWDQVWRLCERERISVLGISPSAVRGIAAARPLGPEQGCDLSALRAFVTTGETWDPASWRWLFDRVGHGRLPIINYSGGTEIGGGILTCYTALPLNDCAFAGPVVGMDVDIILPEGEDAQGAVGELVVRNIWPGMTHSFWGGDDELYLDTYWSTFPGVWRHGDLAQRDGDGWWYVRGRSDDTLKVAGRRVGPVEIEDALLQLDGIVEAVVVGIPDELKGQSVVAFVIPAEGATVTVQDIQTAVRASLGPSLVPSKIHFVKSLPKTRNGKVVRRAIAARYLGHAPGDLSTLENVDAILAIPPARA